MVDARCNVSKALSELRDKFDHFILGPESRSAGRNRQFPAAHLQVRGDRLLLPHQLPAVPERRRYRRHPVRGYSTSTSGHGNVPAHAILFYGLISGCAEPRQGWMRLALCCPPLQRRGTEFLPLSSYGAFEHDGIRVGQAWGALTRRGRQGVP